MTSPTSPLVAIVGGGHGLGVALSARFAEGRCLLALLSRTAKSRAPVSCASAVAPTGPSRRLFADIES